MILRTDLRSKREPEFEVRAEIDDHAGRTNLARGLRWAFAIEVVVLLVVQWHDYFLFDEYVLPPGDQGSYLAAQYLVGHGLRPELDLRYLYGLLPLLIGKLPFGAFGYSPLTYAVAATVIELFVAVGVARIAAALELKVGGQLLLLLTLPLLITRYDNLAYALEAVFLTNAFAEQLRGRLDLAIALALCAALCKPAIGYVYVAVLLFFLLSDVARGRNDRAGAVRALRVPVVTGTSLALLLAAVFGPGSLFWTIVPVRGLSDYRASGQLGLQFHQAIFIRPPSVNWHYYVGTYVTFWVVGALWLITEGIVNCVRWIRGNETGLGRFVFTMGLLALANFLLFDGRYQYIVVPIGVIACASGGYWQRRLAICLCLIAIPAFIGRVRSEVTFTKVARRGAVTAWLWAAPELELEWEHAIAISAGKKTAALGEQGAAGLVFSGIAPPAGACFARHFTSAVDLKREYDQLESAQVVVLFYPSPEDERTVLDDSPSLGPAVSDDPVVYQGRYLKVLERTQR